MRIATFLFTLSLFAGPRPEKINPSNVSRLKVAWIYDTHDPIGSFRKDPRFEATPVYADGKLYISSASGSVVSLDAETGREIWKTDLRVARDFDYSDFANRGVTLAGDTIFVGTPDARLIAIDRATGK